MSELKPQMYKRPRWILQTFNGVLNMTPVYYWRLRSYRNKKIVCTGHEAFKTAYNARRAFMALPFPPESYIIEDET